MTTLHDIPTATKPTAGQPTCVDLVVEAGDGALIRVPAGGRLRIVDLHGNQAVDTLLYDAFGRRQPFTRLSTPCASRVRST